MYELLLIVLFVLLIIVTRYFSYLVLKFGSEKYYQHVTFEGADTPHFFSSKRIVILALLDLLIIGYFTFIIFNKNYLWPYSEFLLGFLITMYTAILAHAIATMLIFRHAICHPEDISGQARLKSGLLKISILAPSIQLLIPLLGITIISPSPALFGALASIGLMLIINSIKIFFKPKTRPDA